MSVCPKDCIKNKYFIVGEILQYIEDNNNPANMRYKFQWDDSNPIIHYIKVSKISITSFVCQVEGLLFGILLDFSFSKLIQFFAIILKNDIKLIINTIRGNYH